MTSTGAGAKWIDRADSCSCSSSRQVLHTPRTRLRGEGSLELLDGAVAISTTVRSSTPAPTRRWRRVSRCAGADHGARSLPLLWTPTPLSTAVTWVRLGFRCSSGCRSALPEELGVRSRDARTLARLRTRARVHGPPARSSAPTTRRRRGLFAEAERAGLRITSGLVVSDRNLHPELELDPQAAYDNGRQLAERWHGRGRLRYAVSPRLALSCSEGMLDSCGALNADIDGALVTSHLNEHPAEVELVAGLFRMVGDYLATYERFNLVGPGHRPGHNLHAPSPELTRLAAARASVAHCPASNAFLGSGSFPLRANLDHGVRWRSGRRRGGHGPSGAQGGAARLKMQMYAPRRRPARPAPCVWLATAAGAARWGSVIGGRPPARESGRPRPDLPARRLDAGLWCCATATRPNRRGRGVASWLARKAWPRCRVAGTSCTSAGNLPREMADPAPGVDHWSSVTTWPTAQGAGRGGLARLRRRHLSWWACSRAPCSSWP